METNGKAVGLIPQAPQHLHPQLLGLADQGLLGTGQKHLLPLLGQGAHQ